MGWAAGVTECRMHVLPRSPCCSPVAPVAPSGPVVPPVAAPERHGGGLSRLSARPYVAPVAPVRRSAGALRAQPTGTHYGPALPWGKDPTPRPVFFVIPV